jgi:spore coat protein U-like protein
MKKVLFIVFALVFCMFLTDSAKAGTTTGYLDIEATAAVTCVMYSTTINFGVYTGDFVETQSDIGVQCTLDTPYTISYGEGNNFDGSLRYMLATDSVSTLRYRILCIPDLSATEDQECGDGTTFGIASSGIGDGTVQSWPIRGILWGQQFVPADHFSDQVVITVTF